MKHKRVFLDTSFFIRLFNPGDPDHQNAKTYYQRFRNQEATILLSTIVVAEYGVGGSITDLPFRDVRLVNFLLNHARFAAELAREAFLARRLGAIAIDARIVVSNDTKLIAQAQTENVDVFIARDDNCASLCQFFRAAGLITFDFLDLRTSPASFFGELFDV